MEMWQDDVNRRACQLVQENVQRIWEAQTGGGPLILTDVQAFYQARTLGFHFEISFGVHVDVGTMLGNFIIKSASKFY
jgi:hypothetical protein